MHHLQPGELQEPRAGEVRALPDARGAIGELVRIGLDVGDQFRDRFDPGRGMGGNDVRDPDHVADRLQLLGLVIQVLEDAVGDRVRAGIADQDGVPVALLRTTSDVPMVPPAPDRFSTIADWPQTVCRCAASIRPITSVEPPAAAGTIRRTVSVGRQSPRQGSRAAGQPRPKRRLRRSARGGGKCFGHVFAPCLAIVLPGSVGTARRSGKPTTWRRETLFLTRFLNADRRPLRLKTD